MAVRTVIGIVVALAAAVALIVGSRPDDPVPAVPDRLTVAEAWPRAARADLPSLTVLPELFLDAETAVGTLPTPDGASLRLLIETATGGPRRELRRVPAADGPVFGSVRATHGHLIWTESGPRRPVEIWAVGVDSGAAPRRLTADTGNALLNGEQHDLEVADGRVHWAAAADLDSPVTEIRSVALTGGEVQVREVPGEWALSTWPWVTDSAARAGAVLRNLESGREIRVPGAPAESVACTPAWCRVLVEGSAGVVRIDLMRPDGSDRRRIAGARAATSPTRPGGQAPSHPGTTVSGAGPQPAVAGVALLDRFEVLAETTPGGTTALVVHDIATGRTVTVAEEVDGAYARDGMLWWSTADNTETTVSWHTLDLRTV